MSCATISRAGHGDQIVTEGGVQALLAHLIAIRSQLDSLLGSQAQLHDAVLLMKESTAFISPRSPSHFSPPRSAREGSPRGGSPRGGVSFAQAEDEEYEQVQKEQDMLSKTLNDVESKHSQNRKSKFRDREQVSKEREKLSSLVKRAEREEAVAFTYRRMTAWERLRKMPPSQQEALIDAATGALVVANTVVVGLSADESSGWEGWQWLDVCFTLGFLTEMVAKVLVEGLWPYFRNTSHWLDFLLVIFDLVQTALWLASTDTAGNAYALARVVRLARLSRISRVLRLTFSQDLVRMTSGISGSMPTLLWSVALVLLSVYVMALVFRETIGRSDVQFEVTGKYFDTVPRSTLTLFRCAFGDCTTSGGSPIFEHVTEYHSGWHTVAYGIFLYFVAIGLFNVISAIFVESTMMAAKEGEIAAKAQRLADERLWATRIATLLRVIMRHSDEEWEDDKLSDHLDSILAIQLSRKDFDTVVQDEEAAKALDELDICREDHQYLSNILDPDNSEVVSVTEIIQGIESLRGEPRRSDIVAVDLMVRSLQTNMQELAESVESVKERSSDSLKLIMSWIKGEVSRQRLPKG